MFPMNFRSIAPLACNYVAIMKLDTILIPIFLEPFVSKFHRTHPFTIKYSSVYFIRTKTFT